MNKNLIIILAILNLTVSVIAVVYYCLWLVRAASDALTWGLPVLITAIFTLIAGIFTFKKRSFGWALAGLSILGAVIIFLLVSAWILSWTMS